MEWIFFSLILEMKKLRSRGEEERKTNIFITNGHAALTDMESTRTAILTHFVSIQVLAINICGSGTKI